MATRAQTILHETAVEHGWFTEYERFDGCAYERGNNERVYVEFTSNGRVKRVSTQDVFYNGNKKLEHALAFMRRPSADQLAERAKGQGWPEGHHLCQTCHQQHPFEDFETNMHTPVKI